MSIAYKRRKKAIRDKKRELGVNIIPRTDFLYLQANWQRQVDGPCIGTLEQFVQAHFERSGKKTGAG